MKPQLRGRIRRNIVTLLELNADVTVLTIASNHDFFVGLEHPRLRAEFMEARSLYVRLSEYTSRRSREKTERRRARIAGRTEGSRPARRVLLAPAYLVAGTLLAILRLLAPVGRLVVRAGSAAGGLGLSLVVGGWRRLPLRVRRAGWAAARWQVRSRRRARQRWARHLRPGLLGAVGHVWQPVARVLVASGRGGPGRPQPATARPGGFAALRRSAKRRKVLLARALLRQRRSVARSVINRRLAVSRAAIRRTKDLLRPWHRTSRFFAFWRETAERTAQLAPDLVVSSDLPGLVGAGRAARRLGLPHLHDCHELYLDSTSFRPLERRLLAPLERRYLRRADSVVAVNHSIAGEYGRRYGREPAVVRNCAPRLADDLNVRDLRALVGLPPTSQIVLYQGGFSAGRGLDVCVAAVADLTADVHLVLLGYGPLRDHLVDLARRHGVAERVHVVDAVPPEELASYTISATVGLMPYQPVSRNNLLALPNKVFEYTAVGVPIVVSDLPELRRIALEEGCGRVYDPFDASSLASALREVLDLAQHHLWRDAARTYGRANVWENERKILIGEMLRVSPQLRLGVMTSAAPADSCE